MFLRGRGYRLRLYRTSEAPLADDLCSGHRYNTLRILRLMAWLWRFSRSEIGRCHWPDHRFNNPRRQESVASHALPGRSLRVREEWAVPLLLGGFLPALPSVSFSLVSGHSFLTHLLSPSSRTPGWLRMSSIVVSALYNPIGRDQAGGSTSGVSHSHARTHTGPDDTCRAVKTRF
jgi:hypothetical protein